MALTKAHNRMIEGAAVNVKDFGAVGDGVTDDTAAIQAALNSGVAKVIVPDGTYLSSTLTISSNTIIFIIGILKASSSIGTSPFIQLSSIDNVVITGNGTIDGNNAVMGGLNPPVIQISGNSSSIEISGLNLINPPDRFIDVYVSTNTITDINIHNNYFDHNSDGEAFAGFNNSARTGTCKRIKFSNNICRNGIVGVRFYGCEQWEVSNNYIGLNTAFATEGVGCFNGNIDFKIIGNTIECSDFTPFGISMGIETITWENVVISDNLILAKAVGAIGSDAIELVVRDGGSTKNWVISNNVIDGHFYGITTSIDQAVAGTLQWEDTIISGNSINSLHRGIGLINDGTTATAIWDGIEISSNTIALANDTDSAIDVGVYIRDWNSNASASNINISSNIIKDAHTGIRTDASNTGENIIVSGNIVRDCSTYGIWLKGDQGRNVKFVSSNNISENNGTDYLLQSFSVIDGCMQKNDIDSTGLVPQAITTFTADDTTPDVANAKYCLTVANTSATAITQFDNGRAGQELIIHGRSGTNAPTMTDGGNFALSGNITLSTNTVLHLITHDGTNWTEISRSVN